MIQDKKMSKVVQCFKFYHFKDNKMIKKYWDWFKH